MAAKVSRKPAFCVVCQKPIDKPLSWRHYHTCERPKCRLEFWRQERVRARERDEAQRKRNEAIRKAVCRQRNAIGAEMGIRDADSFVTVLVPTNSRRIVPLSDGRRVELRDHLIHLLDVASAGDEPSESGQGSFESPAPDMEEGLAVLAQACATCRGYCCLDGQNHGYLTRETLRRCFGAEVGGRPEDVFAAYEEHLMPVTYEDSCIFHTDGGCSLPRTLRSGTCTGFECRELVPLHELMEADEIQRVFLAAMDGSRLIRWAWSV